MALESATYINGLVPTNPTDGDEIMDGDNHLRLIKATLKNTFPQVTEAITATAAELNKLAGHPVSAADLTKLNTLTATAAELNKLAGLMTTAAELGLLAGINTPGNPGLVPPGSVMLWTGSTTNIPAGWVLCNGANNTPDLRDRFVVGAGGNYSVGMTGGAVTVTLTEGQMPSHAHWFGAMSSWVGDHDHALASGDATSGSTHGFGSSGAALGGGDNLGSLNYFYNSAYTGVDLMLPAGGHNHSVSGATDNRGSNQPHENRPPFYALCYIMKV